MVVTGGANTDVAGFAGGPLVPRDSNPGHVRVSPGGVGRNVAENLARLGVRTHLIAAFGEGHDARGLIEECRAAGIVVVDVPVPGVPGSRYLAILDEHGDLALAVSDMRATESLTPEALQVHASLLAGAAAIVLDTNLPEGTLQYCARRFGDRPILLDCVSVAKAPRARDILDALWAVKANVAEAAALTGSALAEPLQAARALRAAGAARAFVTAGARGAAWSTPAGEGILEPPAIEVENATGAGDALTAGLVYALMAGFDDRRAVAFGSAMSRIALTDERTVSLHVSLTRALDTMEMML